KNLDTPDVVYNRYVLGKKDESANYDTETKLANNLNIDSIKDLPKTTVDYSLLRKPDITETDKNCFNKISRQINYKTPINPQIFKCENGNYLAYFTYKGDANKVEIAGDFTQWKPKHWRNEIRAEGVPSNSIIGTAYEFAPTARVEYKLIVDGKWITDPLNPNKIDNGVGGENSIFKMPDYQPTKWLEYQKTNGEKFFLPSNTEEIEVQSKIFGTRRIKVYLPGGYDSSYKLEYPVLYVMDGTDYIERAKATLIQETLVDAGKIKPFIMVFVDYKDRTKEYWASDDYAKFLATEVVPAIDKQYNTIKNRDGRAILGASLGGITSVHTALKYPEIFSRVGGQSSSFWVDDKRVIKELETLDPKSKQFRFYFDTGTLEGVENSRRVNDLLRGKGFSVVYEEGQAGHNWTAWRDRLADAFVALWK
ncbi:MAG: alpha/beta hydrolase-fold protein, partial [Acidobacteriota bacterium]